MKSVIYEFDPVIYPYSLLVAKKFDVKELMEKFYVLDTDYSLSEADVKHFLPNPQTIARTLFVVSKKTLFRHVMILLVHPRYIGDGIITHESIHTVNIVAEALGFLPEKSTEDEPCAYFGQWVAECLAHMKRGKPELMKGVLYEA